MANPEQTSILVTGATGMVGSYLLRYLVYEGYTNIKALKRDHSPLDLVNPVLDKVNWINCDLLDIVGLEAAMTGVDQVYHCAAFISFDKREVKEMYKVNQEGTANVANIALHLGVKKLVYVSSIAAIGRPKNARIIDEKTKWEHSPHNTNYGISKYLAEQEIWRAQAEGLTVAVVNPAMILGGGFWDRGPLKLLKLVSQQHGFYPTGANGFVDVRDVARFLILLMEDNIEGERFILSAASLPYHDLLSKMADGLGVAAPRWPLKPWMGALAWRIAALARLFAVANPPVTKETISITSLPNTYSNQKSKTDFEFHYLPIDQSIREMTQLFLEATKDNYAPKILPLAWP
ncbi:MAG: NAD-dependent epimerase/dehydratase family protein [Saprospiraceae bacterium]